MYQSYYSLPSVSFIGGTSFRFIFEMDKLPEYIPRDKGRLIFNFALSDYQIRDFSTPRIDYVHSALQPSSHFTFKETVDGVLQSVIVIIDPERTVYLRGKYLYQLTVMGDDGECYIDGQGSAEITKNLNPDFIGDDEHTVPDEDSRISAIIALAESYPLLAESYAHGGTGTRSGEDSDNAKYYAESAASMVDALSDDAERAENAAFDAETSKNAAAVSASAAASSASSAQSSATQAQTSESTAIAKAAEAAVSAENAAESATSASNASTSAESAKNNAESARDTATNAATTASSGAAAAATSADNAASSATSAATSETNASNSATQAAQSASEATRSKNAAETSASNAATSATSAEGSATLAESYARGGTNTRAGEDVDNALYYKKQASDSATMAAQSLSATESAKAAAEESAANAADSASDAEQSAQTSTSSSIDASAAALLAESYAHGGTGSRNGENTDNAKYWSERAAEIAGGDFATHSELNAVAATIGYVYISASQPASMTVYDVWYKEVN